MPSTQVSSSRNEIFFLKFDIDDIKGPSLPTNGDVLRYYFYCRETQPIDAPRAIARIVVDKCIKIWSDNGIPTTHEANCIKYLLKMLNKFNTMRSKYDGFSVVHKKQTLAVWEEKFDVIFSIGTKDAVNTCSKESRKMLLAAKEKLKEFRKATNNDKWLVNFEKQEQLLKTGSKLSEQSKVIDNTKNLVDKPTIKDVNDDTKRLVDQQKRKLFKTRSKSLGQSKVENASDNTKKLVDQPTVKNISDDTKKLVDQQKRKLGVNRPGPKSSKKQRIVDASDKNLKTVSVSSILFNSDTLNNNQTAKLMTTTTTAIVSNSIQQELDSEKQCQNSTISPSGLDVDPEEEDIIPPMVQKTIIKEEIDMDWDQMDNWSTSVLFHENFAMAGKENNYPFEQLVNFSHMTYQY